MLATYASISDMRTWADGIMEQRAADFVIGPPERPYLRRWWLIPRNEQCNVYLHEILRSDDDRAGHDHPWQNRTLVIDGCYDEIIYDVVSPWLEDRIISRRGGDCIDRAAEQTHRLVVPEGGRAVTLFMTGPKVRDWGFWCPGGAWVHWREFTAGDSGELVGKGCEG